jgi:hypothetical protein
VPTVDLIDKDRDVDNQVAVLNGHRTWSNVVDNQVVVLDGSSTHSNAGDNQVVVLDGGSTQSHAIGVLCPGIVALDARDITVDDDIVEEVWCTPPIPYTGQTFCSYKYM